MPLSFLKGNPVSEAAELTESPLAIVPTSSPLAESQPPISAVARCVEAYTRAYKAERVRTRNQNAAMNCAQKAFRAALPTLAGRENIRDFIACIAQGILLDVIDTANASKLLYAAQVAIAATRVPSAPVKPHAAA
jgi:hypothetical protein